MPGMPGDQVLTQLRADPRTRTIPVLVLSADATSQSQERLLGLGATAYIVKPFQATDLLDAVDKSVQL